MAIRLCDTYSPWLTDSHATCTVPVQHPDERKVSGEIRPNSSPRPLPSRKEAGELCFRALDPALTAGARGGAGQQVAQCQESAFEELCRILVFVNPGPWRSRNLVSNGESLKGAVGDSKRPSHERLISRHTMIRVRWFSYSRRGKTWRFVLSQQQKHLLNDRQILLTGWRGGSTDSVNTPANILRSHRR